MDGPDWWSWDLEPKPHLFQKMLDRRFNEVDLRLMLEAAVGLRDGREGGRFVIKTTHDGRPWEVVVEPSSAEQVLIVVTTYPVG
ncbi:MAG: hypothetical protein JO075_01730 [Acidimicrobiia bacterium]|nr:hypothetical protein [Acidimicrobiia bacterium]